MFRRHAISPCMPHTRPAVCWKLPYCEPQLPLGKATGKRSTAAQKLTASSCQTLTSAAAYWSGMARVRLRALSHFTAAAHTLPSLVHRFTQRTVLRVRSISSTDTDEPGKSVAPLRFLRKLHGQWVWQAQKPANSEEPGTECRSLDN